MSQWCAESFVLGLLILYWTDFTNVFSPNNFKKNDEIILEYFQ